EHSSSDLQFPMWIYYAALPTGGGLMLIRYGIRLIAIARSSARNPMPSPHPGGHELPGVDLASAMAGFLTLFVALIGAGMPVFLVLGICAGAVFTASGQPLVGVAQLLINELNSPTLMALPLFVMAAAFMRFGGIANALVNLAAAWLGGLPGSLGLVTVV